METATRPEWKAPEWMGAYLNLMTERTRDVHTIDFVTEWMNRDDNVIVNAPAALQACAVSGFVHALIALRHAGLLWPTDQTMLTDTIMLERHRAALKEYCDGCGESCDGDRSVGLGACPLYMIESRPIATPTAPGAGNLPEAFVEIDQLQATATPGQWLHDEGEGMIYAISYDEYGMSRETPLLEAVAVDDDGNETPAPADVEAIIDDADAQFVVALVNAWPEMRRILGRIYGAPVIPIKGMGADRPEA